jgi:hypothetical protein
MWRININSQVQIGGGARLKRQFSKFLIWGAYLCLKYGIGESYFLRYFSVMRKEELDSFQLLLADRPQALAYWQAHLLPADSNCLCELLADVDDSPFTFVDWVEALVTLNNWLVARDLVLAELSARIGYVSCAAEVAGVAGPMSHLPSIVADFLQAYGCEQAVKN